MINISITLTLKKTPLFVYPGDMINGCFLTERLQNNQQMAHIAQTKTVSPQYSLTKRHGQRAKDKQQLHSDVPSRSMTHGVRARQSRLPCLICVCTTPVSTYVVWISLSPNPRRPHLARTHTLAEISSVQH